MASPQRMSAFDFLHRFDIGIARMLAGERLEHRPFHQLAAVLIDAEQPVVFGDQIGDASGVMIEDGDVAAGHVGDMHLVAVLDQPDQRASHADDVIVRVRAKADHSPRLFARRMINDRSHELLKYLMRDFWGWAMMPQKLMQIVAAKVVVGQLEQRLAGLLAEPQNGSLDNRLGPFDASQGPRRLARG